MTKKSALTMAAGLALALLVGVSAITLTFGGTSAANASRDREPIVKRQVQTVTVHRTSDGPATAGVRVVHLSSPGSATSSGSDDSFENEADDDAFEDEDALVFDDGPDQGSSFSGSHEDD
jgi:hypothetical protein